MKEFISPDELKKIKKVAQEGKTLQGKLRLYDGLAQEYEIPHPRYQNVKSKRSKLGMFVNKLFSTQEGLILPIVGRRQQIGCAIKYGKAYLIENPEVGIYFAAAMGAAQEYREWMASIGDLTEEQQTNIINSERS